MERLAASVSRLPVLGVVAVLLAVNAVLFLPATAWVVPDDPGIEGMPTITHLQLAWTGERFSGYLAEWSGEACAAAPGPGAPCVWRREGGALDPAPVASGPAGLRRSILALDLTFPLLYALFAVGLGTRLWRSRRWWRWAMAAAVVAGVCDLTENTIHLWLLGGVDTWTDAAAAVFPTPAVASASAFATVKYAILAALSAGAVATLGRRVVVRMRRDTPGSGTIGT